MQVFAVDAVLDRDLSAGMIGLDGDCRFVLG